MITHIDYDAHNTNTTNTCLPEVIDKIEVTHDGGRLYIYINDKEIYTGTSYGVRDYVITLDRVKQPRTRKTNQ